MSMSGVRLGTYLAALSALLAAAFFIPYKAATSRGAVDTVVIAMLLPAAVFNTLTAIADRRNSTGFDATAIGVAIGLGLLTVVGNVSATEALARLDAGMTSLLLQTQILFVSFASWLILSERISGRFVVGTIIAGAGFAVVRLAGGGSVAGDGVGALWAFGAAFGFGMMHVLTRKYIQRIQPVAVNALRLWIAVALLLMLPGRAAGLADLPSTAWLLAGTAALFGPFLARNCIMYAVKYIPASHSTLIALITPVFAFGLELIFLGTSPTAIELLGGAIILLGVAIPLVELSKRATQSG